MSGITFGGFIGPTVVSNIKYKGDNGKLYICDNTAASAYTMTVSSVPDAGKAILWCIGGGAAGTMGQSGNNGGNGGGGGGYLAEYDLHNYFDPSGNAGELDVYTITVGEKGIQGSTNKVGYASYIYESGPNSGYEKFIVFTGGGGYVESGVPNNSQNFTQATATFLYPQPPPTGNNINGKTNYDYTEPNAPGFSITNLTDASDNPYFPPNDLTPSNSVWFGANGGNGGYDNGGGGITSPTTTNYSSSTGVHGGSGGIGSGLGNEAGTNALPYGNGGGGGGANSYSGANAGSGSDGVVLIWLADPAPPTPSKPDDISLNATTMTYNSITARGDPTGITNSPTSAKFYLYNSAETKILAQSTVSPDASGNYSYTFTSVDASGTELSPSTNYKISWLLSNAIGSGTESNKITFQTEALPVPSKPGDTSLDATTTTYNSIIARGDPTDITNSPTSAIFYLYDSAGLAILANSGTVFPDASGNYSYTFTSVDASGTSLSELTNYKISWLLYNAFGSGTESNKITFQTLAIQAPSQPNVSTLSSTKTHNTITIIGNPTTVTGPYTSATFIRYSSNESYIEEATTSVRDASGNYSYQFTSIYSMIFPNTLYKFKWKLTNNIGVGLESTPFYEVTTGPLPLPSAPGQLTGTSTYNSITLSGNPANVSNIGAGYNPITALIRLFEENGVSFVAQSFSLSTLDSSGNYSNEFTGLQSSKLYKATWNLTNSFGDGAYSSPQFSISTAAPPLPSTPAYSSLSATATSSSITIRGNPAGISNIGPNFSPILPGFIIYQSGSILLFNDSDFTIDSSGNYLSQFIDLLPNTQYEFSWKLINTFGQGEFSDPVFLFSTLPDPPSSGSLTSTSKTSTSITLKGDTTGITGTALTAATFGRYDASGNSVATVAGTVDGSGNYVATFNSLTPSTTYSFRWSLTNSSGAGSFSSPALSVTTNAPSSSVPSTPASAPTVVSYTYNSVTVSGNPTGITGSPTSATFSKYDASGTLISPSQTVYSVDASGNYSYTFTSLNPSTTYKVAWFLTNGTGDGSPSTTTTFTTAALPAPSAPANGSLTATSTSDSITLTGNPSSVPESPFSSATFNQYDASGTQKDSQVIYSADGSGNYVATFSSFLPSTTYYFKWLLTNATGDGTLSSIISASTTAVGGNPPCFARGSKILALNQGLREEYIPIENIRKGDLVKTFSGAYIKVHTIGRTMFKNPETLDRGPNRLFKLTPANYPELTEDLILTGCHSILVDKLEPRQKEIHLMLMPTLYTTGDKFRLMAFIDEKAEPYINPGDHEIWHFALENDNPTWNYGVYANGLLVETASIKNMVERSGLVPIE